MTDHRAILLPSIFGGVGPICVPPGLRLIPPSAFSSRRDRKTRETSREQKQQEPKDRNSVQKQVELIQKPNTDDGILALSFKLHCVSVFGSNVAFDCGS